MLIGMKWTPRAPRLDSLSIYAEIIRIRPFPSRARARGKGRRRHTGGLQGIQAVVGCTDRMITQGDTQFEVPGLSEDRQFR